MFDNLTSINFSLVSVRQTRRRYADGVCCRVQKKPNSGLIQADSGEILSLLVCASLEFGYSCRWKQLYIIKTLRSDIHPYRQPL